MKKIILSLIILFMTLLFAGCGVQEVKYQNQNLGFEVSYPSNWKVTENTDNVIFKSPQDGDKYISNFGVDVYEQNPELSEENFFSSFPSLEKSERITINGFPAKKKSESGGNLIQDQILVLKDNKYLYILTITYPKEEQNNFIETRDMVINSFKLI